MTNQEFVKLLKNLLRWSADENDVHDLVRCLWVKDDESDLLAWYGFEEVLYEEHHHRGRWHFNPGFNKSERPAMIQFMTWALKTELFDKITAPGSWAPQGWIVPFTIAQQRWLKNLSSDFGTRKIPLVRLREEFRSAGLKHHFWLFSYDSIDSIGFFSEGDAVIARCMIDDFDWQHGEEPW